MLLCMAALSFSAVSAQTYETRFARPLSDVLNDVAARFQVRLKYDIDTVGRILPYADFRIRPYSLEETLTNVLSPFDYKFVKQSDTVYKLKPYEYARRTDVDGEKMLSYLSGLYTDKDQWEQRTEILRKEVRQRLGLDDMLKGTVKDAKPILSKVRKFDGYTVQNFALETLPGLYVCGSVYAPRSKGKHALIICPNGHLDRDATGRINSNVWLHWRVWGLFVWIMTCMDGVNPPCRWVRKRTIPVMRTPFRL